MKSHKIGVNTYSVFSREEEGGVWILQFIWGKKDFRIYLGRENQVGEKEALGPPLRGADGNRVIATRLEYLYAFEWYTYAGVSGHGLDREEVCWERGGKKRYVELPKPFLEIAQEVACMEFGLERTDKQLAG